MFFITVGTVATVLILHRCLRNRITRLLVHISVNLLFYSDKLIKSDRNILCVLDFSKLLKTVKYQNQSKRRKHWFLKLFSFPLKDYGTYAITGWWSTRVPRPDTPRKRLSSSGTSQTRCLTCTRRKIRLIESNAKCRHLKKSSCNGTLRQVYICLRPPPLLSFVWGGLEIL
jgi:hypothetical protein